MLKVLFILAGVMFIAVAILELNHWVRVWLRNLFSNPERDAREEKDKVTEFLDSVDELEDEEYYAWKQEQEEEAQRRQEEIDESFFGG